MLDLLDEIRLSGNVHFTRPVGQKHICVLDVRERRNVPHGIEQNRLVEGGATLCLEFGEQRSERHRCRRIRLDPCAEAVPVRAGQVRERRQRQVPRSIVPEGHFGRLADNREASRALLRRVLPGRRATGVPRAAGDDSAAERERAEQRLRLARKRRNLRPDARGGRLREAGRGPPRAPGELRRLHCPRRVERSRVDLRGGLLGVSGEAGGWVDGAGRGGADLRPSELVDAVSGTYAQEDALCD